MPRLSIIVPIYKVANYLPQCLQSLRDQTAGSDIEIICVNDGSPDISPAIADLFAQVDSRIVIVNQEHSGPSSARNAGIAAATGDYVAFVDGDDYVKDWFAECLFEAFSIYSPDVVVFGADVWPKTASNPWLELVLSPKTTFHESFSEGLMEDPATFPFVWRVAVRRELLLRTGLRFDEDLDYGEDQVFLLGLYPRAQRVAVISSKPYVYRAERQGSIMEERYRDVVLSAHDRVRITEHTLRDWQEQGFLTRWGHELFFWSIGQCVPDILRLTNPARTNILVYLACVYKTFYSQKDLEAFCSERGELVPFAQAVLTDRTLASGLGRKLTYYAHTFREQGIRPFIERPLWRVTHNRLTQKRDEFLIRFAPSLSPDVNWRKRVLTANAKDSAWLVEILEELNQELIDTGHPPILDNRIGDTESGATVAQIAGMGESSPGIAASSRDAELSSSAVTAPAETSASASQSTP